MSNPFKNVLSWIAKNFSEDPSKMLIWTGVAGWSISSLAQIGAILFNSKISNEQKSFLVPQEMADAIVNIGSFFLITQSIKKTTAKLFSTGKLAPASVRKYLNEHKNLYQGKIGKLNFDLGEVLTDSKLKESYETYKSFGTTVATVGAGILATNIVTPLTRNTMASKMQKNYIAAQRVEKPQNNQPVFKANPTFGMRI